jgi:hypothetical protein
VSTARERLAAKKRRTATVSVALEDATEAVAAANEARGNLAMARINERDETELEVLQQRVDAAEAAVAELHERITFAACAPSVFEALRTDFTGAKGEIDPAKLAENLPPLLAACAVDEDLQDEEFWREQLASGSWSSGEQVHLANTVLGLNIAAPDERVSFGSR